MSSTDKHRTLTNVYAQVICHHLYDSGVEWNNTACGRYTGRTVRQRSRYMLSRERSPSENNRIGTLERWNTRQRNIRQQPYLLQAVELNVHMSSAIGRDVVR